MQSYIRPSSVLRALGPFLALVFFQIPITAGAADLGAGRLNVAGTRLTVSPEAQTVPYRTATIVETTLEGFDLAQGTLPPDLKVVGDFTGPEIDGLLRLETTPGEPFRIPRLSVEGQYQLDDIRLVQGDELLAYASPRSAGVLVTQVLVTRVTSRALTLDEIRSYGLVIDDDNFHAFNFTFGFAVDGQVFDYNVPVIASPGANGGVTLQMLEGADPLGGGGRRGTTSARFKPPQLAPFTLRLESSGSGRPSTGGCLAIDGCTQAAPVSLPGVILFPTDVSLLNQFFSVVVIAKNDAPEGDALVIRDLTAKVSLPPGLRQAKTEPPTPLGVPVPVRVPGPDGVLGTGDDITFLVAQAEGQAEVVVEGRKQGTHVVEFDLHGVLEGFPDGEIRKVTGTAKGAVVVRDPTLGLTISHPDTVRTDEEYSLYLTLSNTGNAPVNLLSLTLPTQNLSGVQVIGSNSRTIPTLAPGESDVVEFRLRSLRTGRVAASTIKAGSQVTPTFELAVGVGDAGIPLSPDAIVLPKSAELLPAGLSREALGMVGLGYSLATAPASALRPELPWIELDRLHEKVYWLSQAGRHVDLGEELFDSVAVLAAEWTGVRDADREWDLLRRTTARGAGFGAEVGQVLAAEAAATSPDLAFERFAATTAFLGPLDAALATGDGVKLSVASRTSGRTVAGAGDDPLHSRGLPFADLYDLDGSQMALLAVPEEGGYRVRVSDSNGGSATLRLLVPEADGTLRTVEWSGVSLAAAGTATVDYRAADTSFTLQVDSDGDGVAEGQLPGAVSTVAPRAFAVIGAAQDPVVVTGHTVEVLFTQDVDLRSLLERDPSHFVLPGKVSNGGLVESERDVASFFEVVAENPFEGLMNTRVVRVTFDNALSPYRTHDMAVNGVDGVTGGTVTGDVVTVETRVTDPGTIVQGTVYGPDGEPVPFAKVELLETDFFYFKIISDPCETHRTAFVEADAQGRFELDYVRRTPCGDLFKVRGFDPLSGHHGTSQGRVRFIGQTIQLDVLMLGRGTVRGRVTYDDGTVPETIQVVGYSPVFSEGREAELGPDGGYEIRDLPVGTVSLGASDRIGSFVYQTVEIARAGDVVDRNLTIFRRPSDEPTGDVRGTVLASDGDTPLFDAYVSLYVDGELVGVERSAFDGTFDFGTVRAGVAQIEAFDGDTGRSGAQLFFEVEPDQVNEVTVLLQDDRGTVEGHVYRQTLSQTTPLSGAVVWVSGTPFNTVTDENGYYRLEGVYAGTRSVLAADLERQVQVSAQVAVSSDGQTVYRDLYFVESAGSGLAGEVLGLTGNPVAGATIHLADGHGGWWKEVTTDLNGRFSIAGLEPGGYEIHAIKGSLGTVARATIRFEGETPFVQIRFRRGTIRGSTRVINESGQLTGVTSLVTYRTTVPNDFGLVGLDLQAHTLETAADGTFELPDALAGRYVLTVSNAFHGEHTFRGEIVFDGEVRQHDVVFRESGTVRGAVLDWDGETPVAGATVNLRHPAFSVYDLTTDDEGRFTFELVPPRSRRFAIDAEIEKDGIFRTARIWVGLTRAGQELDTEIVLPMQGTVSGWVEDSNGALVPGAVVTLREGSYPNRKLVHNADSKGNFSFTNVFVGDVSLSAQAPALGGLGGRDSVEIVEEQQEVFSLIVLQATGEVEGAIFSPETGEALDAAQVTLQRWPSTRTYDSVTAGEGSYRFRLLPLGSYRVRVFDPSTGRFGQSDWVLLDANAQVLRVDVTLQARGDVDGHLYEPGSGLGVPGATIRLYSKSLRPFTTYSSTDVDGYFEFLGIPEGAFSLSTREPEGRRQASGSGEIVEEDQRVTIDLTFEEFGRVVGSVLNPPGLPDGLFANSNVVLYENGRVIGASLNNPFTFEGVLSGRSLEVRAYENGGDHRANVKGKLAAGESEITLDLQMVARGSAAVTVVDSGGAPVPGASVWLRNKGYYGYKSLQASTGPDGRAVFSDIGAGWITVGAGHPTSVLKGSAQGDLTLDGEQVEVVVQLEPSGVVRGRALLSDGFTPATEGLVVVIRGGRTLQLQVDENGDFEFAGVPLGSFSLFVQESFGPGTIERFGSLSVDGEVADLGTLVLDDHDPAVFDMTPATGAADQPLSTAATVRFSEPIDVSRWSGSWITFRKVGGGNVGYTPTWSDGNTVLTLTPNNPLASFTAYDVIVNSAYDLAGRRLSVKGRTTFNTVDVVPPAVVDFLPRAGENQIPLDASILVTFSEPVAFASLSGSALQLNDLTTGTGVTTTFQHLTGERQVLVTPASGLQADRQYRLTVQNVTDNGGNAMAAPVSVTFWSVDTEPPEITSVVFPEGTSYTAGDEVPVQVTAADEWGVASTEVVIEGWTWTDTAEPWELTGVVPITSAAGQITVEIRAADVHGNTGSVTRTLDVAPNPNAVAPAPAVACGREGGWVVPGYAVELGAVATDDETVESIALFVDGVEMGREAPLASSPAAASFLWTPPAGAAPGTVYTVRFEARDFAGNVGATEITLTTPLASATVLTNGTALFPVTYDGTDLVLASGTFQAIQPLDLASLTIARSARMVSEVGANVPLDLTVAGLIDVHCGGAIDGSQGGFPRVTGNGKLGSGPAWTELADYQGGGSHGGVGTAAHASASRPGETYGSIFEPALGGAGGANEHQGDGRWGGAGGGPVRIEAGGIELDGEIRSRGESQPNWGGSGAGGSVLVRTGSLRGQGRVDASGGDDLGEDPSAADGAGGGGRIAIYADDVDAAFDPVEQLRAWGGARVHTSPDPDQVLAYAAPGTVLVRTVTDDLGHLYVSNGVEADGTVRGGPPTQLPALAAGPVTAFEPSGADAWVTSAEPFRPRWIGAWMELTDAAGAELGTFRVDSLDAQGRALLLGAGAMTGATSYLGEWRFDRIEVLRGTGLASSDGVLRLEVTGTMTVEAGATIDVTGRGYAGGTSSSQSGETVPGLVGSPFRTGGSHGGLGGQGDSSATPGEVFDSVYEPRLGGGGGGYNIGGSLLGFGGRPGGGVVELDVGTLVLDGQILARGTSPADAWHTAGAGGTIVVRAASLTGSGLLDASGGDPVETCSSRDPGAGGGGRIALWVDDLSGFDVASGARAWGGVQESCDVSHYAAPGTIFIRETADTYGRLRIDAGETADGTDRVSPLTTLPALGAGPVVSFDVVGPDAWLTATDPFRERWIGVWTVMLDAAGAELGAFRVGDLDAQGRILLEGAGSVTGAASYRGGYRFDGIEISHGAGLAASDPITGASLVLSGDSRLDAEIEATDLVVESGALVRPATGGFLRLQASGTMTVESGATIDVTALGYAGGTSANPDGETAPGLEGSTTRTGGSHGGIGGQGHGAEAPGVVFDSVYEPRLPGGGGGWDAQGGFGGHDGGNGGGVVELEVGALVLDGRILARSESPTDIWKTAGAGGAILVRASSLTGSGLLDASGGDTVDACRSSAPGAGGGGRIALWVDDLGGFDLSAGARARGGVLGNCGADQYAAPGTIVVREATDTYGRLRVDQGGSTGSTVPATSLPSIGKGTVGTVTAQAADLWIEDADPAKLFDLGVTGMWVRIDGIDYPVIDQSADLRRLLLEGAAGVVEDGDLYLGVYKFDSITVTGDAHLVLRDEDETGTYQVDPGSTYTEYDLDPPVVAVTSPPAGTLFTTGDLVAVAAAATDVTGIASATFRFGDQSFVDTQAPYEWTTVAPAVTVEEDVDIEIESVDVEGNRGLTLHTIRVRPVAPGDPPVVTIACPSPGARVAPGTGLDFAVSATHDDGVERVELFVDGAATPAASDFAAPYDFRFDVPAGALDGDVVSMTFRARSLGGVYGELVYPMRVVAGNVVTADTFVSSADTSLDGSSVVVAGGTLTLEGAHTFRDLVVLDGAAVTHPATTAAGVERMELWLTRDLFVACGATIDATAKGYPGATAYHAEGSSPHWIADDFEDGDFAGWTIVDEGDVSGPSNWYIGGTGKALYQSNDIHAAGEPRRGTYALWSQPPAVSDYRIALHLFSGDDDGIGVMFRYAGPDDYYRFYWNRQDFLRRLEKVEDGVVTVLAEDAVRYSPNTWYRVGIVADGPRLELSIDGAPVFTVFDSSHPAGGVGLYSYANTGARFDDVIVAPVESGSNGTGGSHGGRGGSADGSGGVYGNLFDPRDPGAGGGTLSTLPGGGVIRISAAGQLVIDGSVAANGATPVNGMRTASAGGSIRLDGAAILGLGAIEAKGGDAPSHPAGGGGGRIALYGGSIDSGLLDRTLAAGGDAATPAQRGAAGTVFVKRDAQSSGDLILDNGGLDTDHPTELLGFPPGVLDSVGSSTVTDATADFVHDLAGMDLYFEGDSSVLWPITGHDHHGQTLTLDASVEPLTALAGDSYAGLYRFDRVIVRNGAEAVMRSGVQSVTAPEVEAGSSWTDEHLATVTLTSPLAGQVFASGSTVTVTAQADDLFGVAAVDLTMGEEAASFGSAPYAVSFVAPFVTVPTDVAVTAVLRDLAGHEVEDSIVVRIEPSADPVAPVVGLGACPQDGDTVIPGVEMSLPFTLIDDQLLESYRVVVDGVVEHEVLSVDATSVDTTYLWTPPVSAVPGSSILVQVEARDYAGGTGYDEWTLKVPAGSVLAGGQTIDSTWNGFDLTLGAGTYSVTEPLSLQALTLTPGANLVGSAGADLDLDVAGALHVQCGAALTVSGLGHAGGTSGQPIGAAPAGVVGAGQDWGGSHGGLGEVWNIGTTTDPVGEIFDSVYRPHLAGGGAGLDGDGAGDGNPGGGVLALTAGAAVIDGVLRADGAAGDDNGRGGGAGGTIRIESPTLSGTGEITAEGGWARACHSSRGNGAGGGGRIALAVDDLGAFDPASQVRTWGGALYDCGWGVYRYALPGTVYVRDASATYGDLILDAGEEPGGIDRDTPTLSGAQAELPELGSGTVIAFEVATDDAWVTTVSAFPARWLGAWMALSDGAGDEIGVYEVIVLDGAGRALLADAAAAVGAASYEGVYRFDRIEVRNGADLVTSDRLEAGSVEIEGAAGMSEDVTVSGDMTVAADATVSLALGSTMRLSVGGTLTVEADAELNVTGRGFPGADASQVEGYSSPAVLGAGLEYGGSHGGLGDRWDVPPAGSMPGEIYDSVYSPSLPGAGGARDGSGGPGGLAGGGLLAIDAAAVVVDGAIRADGGSGSDVDRGAGAGGTVSITTGALSGSGEITASGGYARSCASSRNVGSGGGGRVAIRSDDLSGFAVETQVLAGGGPFHSCSWGVYRCSASGTVYATDTLATYGDLFVTHPAECAGTAIRTTVLPTPGTGIVGALATDTADPADLWIEPQDPGAFFDLGVTGMWLRIDGSDYRVLDQSADRRSVLLEGAAGLVSIGDAYAGVYKFDTVTVRGGAILEFLDAAEATTFDVDTDSQVITPQ